MTKPIDALATYAVYRRASGDRIWSGSAENEAGALRRANVSPRQEFYAVLEPVHAPGCWSWGPEHYACAVERVRELEEAASLAQTIIDDLARIALGEG